MHRGVKEVVLIFWANCYLMKCQLFIVYRYMDQTLRIIMISMTFCVLDWKEVILGFVDLEKV